MSLNEASTENLHPSSQAAPCADTRSSAGGRGRASQGRGGSQAAQRGGRAALGAENGRPGPHDRRSDTRGRWGKASLPLAPPTHQEDGARQLGVVATLRETFGFIK